ncbi:hypothetical protein BGW80DRAFT_561359 [Lactifluus volemus]|nr:hypothetical protein BGW80DRAFT_561359 [Lactifluus volemus]
MSYYASRSLSWLLPSVGASELGPFEKKINFTSWLPRDKLMVGWALATIHTRFRASSMHRPLLHWQRFGARRTRGTRTRSCPTFITFCQCPGGGDVSSRILCSKTVLSSHLP